MDRIKGINVPSQMLLVCLLLLGCVTKESTDYEKVNKSTENSQSHSNRKASWNNPMITPFGKDLVSIVRGYYLVGEYDKLMDFIIKPNGYSEDQIKEIIRKSSWGYDVKVTNVQWKSDSLFILTVKTTIENTIGSETYQGKVINDTSKLYFFADSPKLFVRKTN